MPDLASDEARSSLMPYVIARRAGRARCALGFLFQGRRTDGMLASRQAATKASRAIMPAMVPLRAPRHVFTARSWRSP